MSASPYVADELTSLRAFLDRCRATLRAQVDGLDRDQLAQVLAPSTMTLGGLIKHLAYVEDWWFGQVLAGQPPVAPWDAVDWKADADWDWHSAVDNTPEELGALFAAAVDRSDALLAERDLDATGTHPGSGKTISARWIVLHMIEEYARHLGHGDLIRESIDGRVDIRG